MPRNPGYVRLRDSLSLGIQVDLASGWGISGKDVRRFPEDPVAARWARRMLNAGVLEEASKAEWDEVHEDDLVDPDDDTPRVVFREEGPIPENKLRHLSDQARRRREEASKARRASPPAEEESESVTDDAYSGLSKDELVSLADERGLSTTGNARTLARRLRADDAAAESEGEENPEGEAS